MKIDKVQVCVCDNVEVIETEKTAYCRCIFSSKNPDENIFSNTVKPRITMVVSGGFFDTKGEPNKERNLAWAKAFAEAAKGRETKIASYTIEVKPFKRVRDGVISDLVNKSVTINVFADDKGNVSLSEQQLTNQAYKLLENLIANDRAVLVDNGQPNDNSSNPFSNDNVANSDFNF